MLVQMYSIFVGKLLYIIVLSLGSYWLKSFTVLPAHPEGCVPSVCGSFNAIELD